MLINISDFNLYYKESLCAVNVNEIFQYAEIWRAFFCMLYIVLLFARIPFRTLVLVLVG